MRVGDYVRIKNGDIGKIKENDGELIKYCVGTLYGKDLDRNCLDREVLKSSPNIIDLLEVGDYVNRHRVSNVFDEYIATEDDQITIDKENIKSIVTHEQFKSMEYKL